MEEVQTKTQQDFTDLIPILTRLSHEFKVTPGKDVTININHGSERQLVLTAEGNWSLQ